MLIYTLCFLLILSSLPSQQFALSLEHFTFPNYSTRMRGNVDNVIQSDAVYLSVEHAGSRVISRGGSKLWRIQVIYSGRAAKATNSSKLQDPASCKDIGAKLQNVSQFPLFYICNISNKVIIHKRRCVLVNTLCTVWLTRLLSILENTCRLCQQCHDTHIMFHYLIWT